MEVVGAAGGEERFHPADCRGGFDEASSQRGGPASPLKPVSHAGRSAESGLCFWVFAEERAETKEPRIFDSCSSERGRKKVCSAQGLILLFTQRL